MFSEIVDYVCWEFMSVVTLSAISFTRASKAAFMGPLPVTTTSTRTTDTAPVVVLAGDVMTVVSAVCNDNDAVSC